MKCSHLVASLACTVWLAVGPRKVGELGTYGAQEQI